VDVGLYNVPKQSTNRKIPSTTFRAIFLPTVVIYKKGVLPRSPRLALALRQLLGAGDKTCQQSTIRRRFHTVLASKTCYFMLKYI
jgi:hypothetical protein